MSETMQLSQICPKLEQLRLNRSFVDLNIIGIDGTRVCAHKVVLAAQWPKIEQLLNDTHNGELSWAKFPSSIIEAAVHFAYTGEIQLDASNTMRVYLLAMNVGSAALEQLCIDFSLPRITRENIEHTWSIALGTGSASLKSGCIGVMRTYFEGFVGSNLFLKLDLETIKVMLNTFDFPGKPEESKLQAIITWVDKRKNRLEYFPELSTLIFQIKSTESTAHDIFLVVEDENNSERLRIIQLDPEGGEVTSVGEIPYLDEPSVVVCASKSSVSVEWKMPLGRFESVEVDRIICVPFEQSESRQPSPIHVTETSLFAILDSIFCLGDEHFSGLVHQFDLVTRTARTPTQLEEPVRFPASAASSHDVIVSGGVNESGQNKSWQSVATCSLYAPATNRWTSLRQLREARHSHRMCWLPDGRVFAIGGLKGFLSGDNLSSVEMLERAWIPAPREEASAEWKNVAPMKTGRYNFGCCVVDERIMVAGGRTNCGNPSSSFESFKPPTATNFGQWTSLTYLASDVSFCFLVPSVAGLLLIDRDDSGMQLGRRKANVASSEWAWKHRPRLTSIKYCRGLVSLPSTAGASQR